MYDLIVVGAGPAGSAAARRAGQMGLETLVLEKEQFPRYKPCGGGLSERAISYLDFALPETVCEKDITGARIIFGPRVLERHKPYRLATTVTRSILDEFLLTKAQETGAEVVTGKKVSGYEEKDDCVKVQAGEDVYRTRHLIISSGSQDRLKEAIRDKDKSSQYGLCLVTEVPEDDRLIDSEMGDALAIHFGVVPMGYGWVFPHNGYYSVGVGGIARDITGLRKTMVEFLRANGFHKNYHLHGHVIPFGGLGRPIASERTVLAGDSAGFVDCFTGEGISYAIRSGQIAAEVVSEKLSDPGMDMGKGYASWCRADFGDDLRYAEMLARLMHSKPGFFFKILAGQDDFVDAFLDTVAMKRSYKSYLSWLAPRLPLYLLNLR
jgi:geranylgeranyl reductase family protein